ncbi:MAG: short-chain dehydrogenase/reductase [Fibrobacteres bacterium]|nr:short-chain dehydrogenase/reductase [Fibrobacterota bacterium]
METPMKGGKQMLSRVLLTGASSGIGLATATLLAARGYRVVGTTRHPEAVRKRLESERGSPLPFALIGMDLTDPASVEHGYAQAESMLGGIDILINNAGQGELGAVEDTPLADSRALFEVNYFSVVRLAQLAIPAMRARGSGVILNMGSIVHDLQFPFKAQYCASKSALTGFSLSLRYELHPHRIRVHILEPGWVRSEFHNRLRPVLKDGSPYAPRLKPFLDFTRDSDPNIPDGPAVARIILATLENPKAPVRIPVGNEAKKFRLARRFLSNAMLDRILLRKLAQKGDQAPL